MAAHYREMRLHGRYWFWPITSFVPPGFWRLANPVRLKFGSSWDLIQIDESDWTWNDNCQVCGLDYKDSVGFQIVSCACIQCFLETKMPGVVQVPGRFPEAILWYQPMGDSTRWEQEWVLFLKFSSVLIRSWSLTMNVPNDLFKNNAVTCRYVTW